MHLIPIRERAALRRGFDELRRCWLSGAQSFVRNVVWQGGGEQHPVHWRDDVGIWAILDATRAGTRYWCCYGTEDPGVHDNFGIACEINFPHEGFDRRVAACLVRDEDDPRAGTLLAHSGKVGGSRKGIGKSAFLAFLGEETLEKVHWPDGPVTDVVVIGRVPSDHLPAQIAHFVRQAQSFKTLASTGSASLRSVGEPVTFTPEFGGSRASYRIERTIESRSDHGPVVSALRAGLSDMGVEAYNDRERDLFTVGPNGALSTLFEVKTDTETSSIYMGVGQLMLQGAAQPVAPTRVLVVPELPRPATQDALRRLGTRVVRYRWRRGKPKFSGIRKVLT